MKEVALNKALGEAIREEMMRDDTVFVIGEDIGVYHGAFRVTDGLLEEFGDQRVIDTPIAELGFIGLAIGAAMTGLRPVVEVMSFNFSFVAADQIISNAAKMYYMSGNRFSVPMVIRGPNGAAAQVSSQHSHCVEAIYSHLPGLIVVAPSNPYDAKVSCNSNDECILMVYLDNPACSRGVHVFFSKNGLATDCNAINFLACAEIGVIPSDYHTILSSTDSGYPDLFPGI